MIRRVTFALFVGGFLSPLASAQTPPAPPTSTANTPRPPSEPQPPAANVAARSSLFDPVPTDPTHPAYHAGAHRSIVRHNPLPRRTGYDSNYNRASSSTDSSTGQSRQSGFSNAGVGRFGEYYDANTLAPPIDNHAVPPGRFDSGGGPDRAEQVSAAQVGNQRAQTTQTTINTYGRPYGAYGAGFGYGLGLAGGGLYSFPN